MAASDEQERLSIIGKNIALIRKERRFTQRELAERCDLSREYIGQIERGETNTTLSVLFKIADALNAYLDISWTPRK